MSEEHTIQKIGYLKEATENTDPISSASVAYNNFGLITQSWGDFPAWKQEMRARYLGSSYDINYKNVARNEYTGAVIYAPVNGIPYYLLFGAVSHAGVSPNAVHTITPAAMGTAPPTFTARYLSRNSTEDIIRSMKGCKMTDVSFSLDCSNPDNLAMASAGFSGRSVSTPSYANINTHYPTFPSSQQQHYRKDDNLVFTWRYGGTPVDYTPDLVGLAFNSARLNRPYWVDGDDDPNIISPGNLLHSFQFDILRGSSAGAAILTDFEAQPTADVFYDLRLGIYNGDSDRYLIFDAVELSILEVKLNHVPTQEGNRIATYSVTGVAKSLTVTVKDDIANTFY